MDSVAPHVVGVKPQLAFFEALGSDGMRALEDICAYARSAGLLVLADAKRGDIGSTARAYAAAFLEPRAGEPPLADAMTVNPYFGRDSLEPFLAACRREGAGLFCVVKSSNEGGADVQDLKLSDGRPLWHNVASLVNELGQVANKPARPWMVLLGRLDEHWVDVDADHLMTDRGQIPAQPARPAHGIRPVGPGDVARQSRLGAGGHQSGCESVRGSRDPQHRFDE